MDLAYTVATGRRFRWGAWILADTLRRCGGFTGDIVLFLDKPMRPPAGARVVLIEDAGILAEAKWMKMRARHLLPMKDYRCVGFIDADIAIRGPIGAFFEAAAAHRRMVLVKDLLPGIGDGASSRCLSEEERARYGATVPSVNGGFFVTCGEHAEERLALWEQMQIANQGRPGIGFCQSGLNACMLRELFPVTRYDGEMWFPKRDPQRQRCKDDAVLAHFHGLGRHFGRYLRLRRMWKGLLRGEDLVAEHRLAEGVPFARADYEDTVSP